MKVALVLNGDPPEPEDLKLLSACDAIVCADGAARALLRADHPPTVIVGDLDSLDPDAYKWADALDVPIERHPTQKDKTDGELALEKVLEMDPGSVLILGGHGGHTAMFLANLKLLRRCHDRGLEAAMVGHGESIRFVSAGGEIAMAGRAGFRLDVLAIDSKAVVDIEGTEWDGEGLELSSRSARGVSNRIAKDGARIVVQEGTVMVVIGVREKKGRHQE